MNATTDDRPTRSVQRVIILHGYEAAPDANWFPWLQGALEAEGIVVTVVPLPTPDAPDKAAWENAVRAALGEPDAKTGIVAHSLGAVTALRVVLFGISDQALPASYQVRDLAPAEQADALLRERSLLYVAATRARDGLVVSWSGQPSELLGIS